MKKLGQWLVAVTIAALMIVASACDTTSANSPQNLPADHTVRNGGTLHKSGFRTPYAASSGCTTCHGANLRGGTATIDGMDIQTPSCFSCHGQQWN